MVIIAYFISLHVFCSLCINWWNVIQDELEIRKRDLAELTEMIAYDRNELALIEKKSTDESQIISAIEEICDQDTETLKAFLWNIFALIKDMYL